MATVPPKKNAPQKEYDEVYNVSRLNVWFAISAVLMLVVTIWMVIDDYTREWKTVQREFNAAQSEKLRGEIASAEQAIDAGAIEELRGQLSAAESDLEQRDDDLGAANAELVRLQGDWYRIDQNYRFAKAIYDAKKFEYEEARSHGAASADKLGTEIEELRLGILDLADETRDATTARDAAQARIDELTAGRDDALSGIKQLRADVSLFEKQLDAVDANFKNTFRNAPVIDFLSPSIKVNQVIVEDLHYDVNFAQIPRTDRCQTCHVKIDEPGFEDAEQPYRTHPNLERYVGSTSSHPMGEFGCTTCHGGRGWGTTFTGAAHTPQDEAQREEWEHEHHWHEMHHWNQQMLRRSDLEANCFKCHAGEIHLDGAPRLNKARVMFFQAGCYGCHEVRGYEDMRRSGPSLKRIGAKTNPDWAYLWISDPPAFRPSRMPKFFGLSNTSSEEDRARSRVEVAAIVEYLFEHSVDDLRYTDTGRGGNTARGEELVNSIGCKACHAVGNEGVSWGSPRFHGPNLMGTGSKVGRPWLFRWLKEPKHYWDETRMPNMRLTDREARDIAAYLMSQTRDGIEGVKRPTIDRDILKTIAFEYLTQRATRRQADEQWSAMPEREQDLYVGERQISRYGCFGCHDIAGFDDAQPIGTELSSHGDKPLFQLDFGFVDIPHKRRDFFVNKMKDPRIYDLGRVKTPQDKLRMGQFSFTDDEAELVAMNVVGFAKERVQAAMLPEPDQHQRRREAGWWDAHERNCIGCHSFDGYGGAIAETIEDEAMHPPALVQQGSKVHPNWLFSFLKEPTTIRPWLEVRMPTFELTDSHATDLVKFFAGLDEREFKFETLAQEASATEMADGRKIFGEFKCQSCHVLGKQFPEGKPPSEWAPDLSMATSRLQPDWIDEWLKDPQALLPGTKMPNFFYYLDEDEGYIELYPDAGKDVFKVREHVMSLGRRGGGGRDGASP